MVADAGNVQLVGHEVLELAAPAAPSLRRPEKIASSKRGVELPLVQDVPSHSLTACSLVSAVLMVETIASQDAMKKNPQRRVVLLLEVQDGRLAPVRSLGSREGIALGRRYEARMQGLADRLYRLHVVPADVGVAGTLLELGHIEVWLGLVVGIVGHKR